MKSRGDSGTAQNVAAQCKSPSPDDEEPALPCNECFSNSFRRPPPDACAAVSREGGREGGKGGRKSPSEK